MTKRQSDKVDVNRKKNRLLYIKINRLYFIIMENKEQGNKQKIHVDDG